MSQSHTEEVSNFKNKKEIERLMEVNERTERDIKELRTKFNLRLDDLENDNKECFHQIAKILTNPDNNDHDGPIEKYRKLDIEDILIKMRNDMENSFKQRLFLRVLWEKCDSDPQSENPFCRIVFELSGHEIINEVMEKHKKDPDILELCCRLVIVLVTLENASHEMVKIGVHSKIIEAMYNFFEDDSLQQTGCGAILLLSRNPENVPILRESGAIDVITQTMNHYKDQDKLQDWSKKTLNLLQNSNDSLVLVAVIFLAPVVLAYFVFPDTVNSGINNSPSKILASMKSEITSAYTNITLNVVTYLNNSDIEQVYNNFVDYVVSLNIPYYFSKNGLSDISENVVKYFSSFKQ